MKSNIMITPENRMKINGLIKMWAGNPGTFRAPVISQDDAVSELIRVFEEIHGPIPTAGSASSSTTGSLRKIQLIGAEGIP